MPFRKYDHVERIGHDYVGGITLGEVYVFPKLDGTNASVWFEHAPGIGWFTMCGSRTRTLTPQADNAGFHAWLLANEAPFLEVLNSGGEAWTIYGEWLVPHTLKTYRKEAWRRFYVFDVYDNDQQQYLSYDEYHPVMKAAGLDVIEPLCIFTNPSGANLMYEAEANQYLIMDGAGCGEGIVIKNYDWVSDNGNQPWAKMVRNEFKEENRRSFGTTEKNGEFQVEAAIAEEYVTQALVSKTKCKIILELTNQDILAGVEEPYGDTPDYHSKCMAREVRVRERHRPQIIPRLLGTVYHELIEEELWTALKQHKDPTINFKKLKGHCILRTKKYAADLF